MSKGYKSPKGKLVRLRRGMRTHAGTDFARGEVLLCHDLMWVHRVGTTPHWRTSWKGRRKPVAERPIRFSGPMVRAILDGKKSQTRRIVKPQATDIVRATGNVNPVYIEDDGFWYYRDPDDYSAHDTQYRLLKPTWAVGDRLWVKETHFLELPGDLKWDAEGLRVSEWPEYLKTQCVVHYKQGCDLNDPEAWCWKSSIFMPRWASRIELVVTEVRVERLQDISEGDAIAEGVICTYRTAELVDKGDGPRFVRRPTAEYEALWDSIYGPGSWDANPYVWVISFEVARG